ncbi:hypothetical protein AAA799O18_00085 [Marine Group I thaumarchaeote SCGC AAA799-O18]|jgi:hypothetical protein|nr:hypothetical protein AAA799O18_00085 [Marine Group I thaumarchaeote SCGC AAA799-O18]
MDVKKLLERLSIKDYPVGIGGCRNNDLWYDCCEFDLTIFDGKNQSESILEYDGTFYQIYHGTLTETSPEILLQYHNMTILLDDQWELRILLSKIKEKQEQLFNSYVKNCLIEAGVCITKAKNGLDIDAYASSWLKCAAYFLADAISAKNFLRPSPTHMLKFLREFDKNKINEFISVLTESIGIERATPSLLSRMSKSTMGFSDMIENNSHSRIISQKYHYLKNRSLFTDCYFYLGYINRNNFIKIKNLHRKPELIHILKTAFDLESDPARIESQANKLKQATNSLLSLIHE